jgi:hypothetical protein
MRITLRVLVEGMYGEYTAGCDIPELIRESFAPLKTTAEPMLAFITGDVLEESGELNKVMELRKDSAKILSESLAELIIGAMKSQDTHNGYPKET